MSNFAVTSESVTKNEKFNLTIKHLNFKINPKPANVDPSIWIKIAIAGSITHAVRNMRSTCKVGITFQAGFEETSMSFRDASLINVHYRSELISKIFGGSSSKSLSFDSFSLKVTSVEPPEC